MTGNTPIYKIFANEHGKILKNAAMNQPVQLPIPQMGGEMSSAEIQTQCQGCSKMHLLYAKLKNDPGIDIFMKQKGRIPFPKDCRLLCQCGFENDLTAVKNDIEKQTNCKLIF